ncbi:MAG: protein phosphatase 2C domain-containing protein, partial [Desulfobacterales bacterium]|nr:protein phosphatase 2C domain-containing protein [Desulfobacterales bacterium]
MSDIGRRRKRNEDGFLVLDGSAELPGKKVPLALFAVADGLGGHAAGEVASKMACEGMKDFYRSLSDPAGAGRELSPDAVRRSMVRAIFDIDERMVRLASTEERYAHMGTTLSAILFYEDLGMIAHVGDSRI